MNVYLYNIAGVILAQYPAIDLAVIVALMSSFRDQALSRKICFCAEVGLAGELSPVHRFEQRVKEADRLRVDRIVCVASHSMVHRTPSNIAISYVGNVNEMLELLFY